MFGVRYLSTLYGIVFLSHQVGSFFGAWAAGYYLRPQRQLRLGLGGLDRLAVFAALVHLPIRDAAGRAAAAGMSALALARAAGAAPRRRARPLAVARPGDADLARRLLRRLLLGLSPGRR